MKKNLKKTVKKGYQVYLKLNYHPIDEKGNYSFEDRPVKRPENYYVPTVEMAKEMIVENQPTVHKLYSSLEDFNIE